ncbi:exodeoxyribonuclease III, partial [Planctomycetota bacterium]
DVVIVNSYVPQGQSHESEQFGYKLNWFKRLRDFLEKHFTAIDRIVWVGDLNIAPESKDVYNPEGLWGSVCFCDEVQREFVKVMDWGFIDIFRKHCDEPDQYTFWDYRLRGSVNHNLGWRLDHIMATKSMADKSRACYIDKAPRLADRPSDHTPIIAEFEL